MANTLFYNANPLAFCSRMLASKIPKEPHLGWLRDYASCIDSELSSLFQRSSRFELESAACEALQSGGKRVRAILALLWCEAYCGDFARAMPVAVAYELAHASALVQDDIIDSSDKRRGGPSIVSRYGLSNAILASDLLLFNVPKMLSKYESLESKRIARLFDLVGEACRGATWGEFLDLEMAKKEEISEEEYEHMIVSKTSSLLASPSASGAIVGGANDQGIEMALHFGKWLGMAYQVGDDVLDVFGNEDTLGKPIFTDFRGGKKNVMLIHCMNHCSEQEREFLLSLLNRENGEYGEQEVRRARTIFEALGSVDYAKARVAHYLNRANHTLEGVRDCRAKIRLAELSSYLSQRSY
jgi:geranylgeranyl diphosphate synthase, type I